MIELFVEPSCRVIVSVNFRGGVGLFILMSLIFTSFEVPIRSPQCWHANAFGDWMCGTTGFGFYPLARTAQITNGGCECDANTKLGRLLLRKRLPRSIGKDFVDRILSNRWR